MNKTITKKSIILLFLLLPIYAYYQFNTLTINNIVEYKSIIKNTINHHFIISAIVFYMFVIILTALYLPLDIIFSLLSGYFFGFWFGLIFMSFSYSVGSTLSFIISRYLLFAYFNNKFYLKYKTINQHVGKDINLYLLSLRLIPIFPDVLINIIMGLTDIKLKNFYLISQIGTLLSIGIFVNAGLQLSTLNSLHNIISTPIILSFTLIGIMPFLVKFSLKKISSNSQLFK
ncbi:TVP38/TMEM64 family protein [Photobacterium phosphoreum]|uniref:TVP38/TMEM64 family protein n=1 Tax=Photobacterium phosphoreum TaxID=659 RepID=UPI000D176D21|nr:VTT domain-containing protein [Photobacterium phosphoreum]PSW32295.1 TVP38/TMEM64 family protein [Photobacterium phosphoreum]